MKKMQRITTWNAVPTAKQMVTSTRCQSYHFGDKRKRVGFDPTVKVVMIPSSHNFDVETIERMWWANSDYESFKENAHQIWKVYGTLDCVTEEEDEYLVSVETKDSLPRPCKHLKDMSRMDYGELDGLGMKNSEQSYGHDCKSRSSMLDGKIFNEVHKDFFMSSASRSAHWLKTLKHSASTSRLYCEKSSLGLGLEIHPRCFSWPGHLNNLGVLPEKN